MIPYSDCVSDFGFSTYVILVAAFLFFLWRTIRVVYQIANYADIKKFYNTALKIEDVSLSIRSRGCIMLFVFLGRLGQHNVARGAEENP